MSISKQRAIEKSFVSFFVKLNLNSFFHDINKGKEGKGKKKIFDQVE